MRHLLTSPRSSLDEFVFEVCAWGFANCDTTKLSEIWEGPCQRVCARVGSLVRNQKGRKLKGLLGDATGGLPNSFGIFSPCRRVAEVRIGGDPAPVPTPFLAVDCCSPSAIRSTRSTRPLSKLSFCTPLSHALAATTSTMDGAEHAINIAGAAPTLVRKDVATGLFFAPLHKVHISQHAVCFECL